LVVVNKGVLGGTVAKNARRRGPFEGLVNK